MAKKSSNRMASRQGRLNKKKAKSKPNVFKATNQITTEKPETEQNTQVNTQASVVATGQPLTDKVSIKPQLSHKKERFSNSAMSVYSYVGSEVKRISIIAAIIFIVLFSLTFVLR